jgi:hypothetical protein
VEASAVVVAETPAAEALVDLVATAAASAAVEPVAIGKLSTCADSGKSRVLKGHDFTGCGKTLSERLEVSGHDFSRAASARKNVGL